MDEVTLDPVAVVRSDRSIVEDDDWGTVEATLEFDDRFAPDAIRGLDAFSHAEVVYLLDQVGPDTVETGSRRPRNNPDWPEVGIFAQRAKRRPNRVGVSRCAVLGVDGRRLHVRALDAVDGTPVLDVKPYMVEFGPQGDVDQPDWASELMAEYY